VSDAAAAASDTLLRLVRFAASAGDARYAFVMAPVPLAPRRLHVWLARDYGVRTDRRTLVLDHGEAAPSTPAECVRALRRLWPDEAELAGRALASSGVVVPLADGGGRLLGQLGVLEPGCLFAGDRLTPLGPLAAAQLAVWNPPLPLAR